jgi:ribosome-binding factor A
MKRSGRSSSRGGTPPEYRRGRVTEAMRKEISEIVRFELADDRVGPTAINHIALTKDKKSARVYVSGAGVTEMDMEETVKALNHAATYIRHQVGQRLSWNRVPELQFIFDKTMTSAMRIEQILDEERPRLGVAEPVSE